MINLVVVESPAKSKTIGKYLNNDFNSEGVYKILATGGHIYESHKVDVNNDFKHEYQLIDSKRSAVKQIEKAMQSADRLYLATDPDREGEAISAHVKDYLIRRGVLKGKEVHRIVFYEVTRKAVLDSLSNPGEISENLVEAQQSRDALDQLVGFNLSPLLIRKLRTPHISAGRVQSPALRLIVERQREIDQFTPVEFWTIGAELSKESNVESNSFFAQLTYLSGKKLAKQEINSQEAADSAVASIEKELEHSERKLTVATINRKDLKKKPPPPFKTSTFVQSATQRLKRSAVDVTRIAQKLYEGLEINGVQTGLITYTRTDSLTLSTFATGQIREFISKTYGSQHIPNSARVYKTKSKTAQEAHEAIRPTDVNLTPDKVRSSLNQEQFAIYELIWKRTIASQMNDAIFDQVSVDLVVADHRFHSTGSTLKYAGWHAVSKNSAERDSDSESIRTLPHLEEGESIPVKQIKPEQHFTKPPPRYTTGSLVRQLEDFGIGRPSTWPTIITKLQNRNYVTVEQQSFYAESLGCIVVDYLNQHFSRYVDYGFTGTVEDKLDEIARGELNRLSVLGEFWNDFSAQLETKLKAPAFEISLGEDPDTKRELLVKVRNGGSFLQLGRRTDEEKPIFRPLPKGTDPGSVSFENAVKQFRSPVLPRTLNEKTRDGRVVEIKSGRYGLYFTCTDDEGEVESFNLDSDIDPFATTIEDIQSILLLPKLPRSLGKSDEYKEVLANRGRFGPYLSVIRADGSKFNVSLGKTDNPTTVSLERAIDVINASKSKASSRGGQRSTIKSFDDSKVQVLDGRYGPYVTDGKINASVPPSLVASELRLETCMELLEKKRKSKPKKRTASRKKNTSSTRKAKNA